jgi:hypothetical protein
VSTTATRKDDALAELEKHNEEPKADRSFGIRFGSEARCAGAFEGRVVRMTIDAGSCRIERIVFRTRIPAHDFVIPAALVERS